MVIKTNIIPSFKNADVKSKLHFALIPHRIGDKYIWLQRYEVLYMYEILTYKVFMNGQEVAFDVGKWIKLSERII